MIESVCCRKDVKTNWYEWEFISRLHSWWHISKMTKEKKKWVEGGVQRENSPRWQAGRRSSAWHPETNNSLRHPIQGNRQLQYSAFPTATTLFCSGLTQAPYWLLPFPGQALSRGMCCVWVVGELCTFVFSLASTKATTKGKTEEKEWVILALVQSLPLEGAMPIPLEYKSMSHLPPGGPVVSGNPGATAQFPWCQKHHSSLPVPCSRRQGMLFVPSL